MSDTLSFVSPLFNQDALSALFEFLDDPLDLAHIFATNKQLSKLASNPELWQRLLQKYFSQELPSYLSVYTQNPFELFKNLYLFRLKQYRVIFGLKQCTKEDFLLFLNMNLGYIKEVDKLQKVSPQKLIKVYGYMMSQKNFELIEKQYDSSAKKDREKLYNQAFVFCCRHNHPEELKRILSHHHEYIDTHKAVTPGLRSAAKLGHIECIEVIIQCKNVVIHPQLIGELFITACSSNKKRTINYFLTARSEMISDHVHAHGFMQWCQHDQEPMQSKFFKRLTQQDLQSGLLNALTYGNIALVKKLLYYFKIWDDSFYFKKVCLQSLAEKNALPGFLFVFKTVKTNLENVFISHLLRVAYQNDAFDIMRFLLDFYQEKLPTYLAQQARLKLDNAMMPVILPTLIFSDVLNNEIDILSEKLEALKIACSNDQNQKNKNCSL